jgi:hypothetical protein
MPGYFFRYVVPKIGKNLAKKRSEQDDIIKTRERVMTEYGIKDPKSRVSLRTKANQPKINKKIADIADRQDKARVKKMGGGMMGRRFGMKKGSGKKFPDLTGDGKVTFADILKGRGVINGKNKKKKKGEIFLTKKSGKRMQAREGTLPLTKRNIKEGKPGKIKELPFGNMSEEKRKLKSQRKP